MCKQYRYSDTREALFFFPLFFEKNRPRETETERDDDVLFWLRAF